MEPGNVRVPEENPALGRAEQAEDRLDQGRLARPVRSDQDDHLSRLQGPRASMEDLRFPIAGPEVLRLEQHAYPPRYDSITAGAAFTFSGRPSAIRRPWCITMTQSHRFMTTFMSCSIRKKVLPFWRSLSIRSMRLPVNSGVTPAAGSSCRTRVRAR